MIKKFFVLFVVSLLLVGCGKQSVSQEEYDSILEEKEELESRNKELENQIALIDKKLELEVKSAEYKARIEEQYKHVDFVLYVVDKATDSDFETERQELKGLSEQGIDNIDYAIKQTEDIEKIEDIQKYDSMIGAVETIYDGWEDGYDKIIVVESTLKNR